jgi:cytochrome c oxidase cbb3-type subunit 3
MKVFFKIIPIIAVFVFGMQKSQAQDGEGLFKAKCNVCHAVDKNSTGPLLKGVKQRWIDAGEGELLYEWMKNPMGLVASGKSKEAVTASNFSPTVMPGQDVSKEETDAILAYVDAYEKPAPAVAAVAAVGGGTVDNVKVVPNYKDNLSLFYWLIGSTLLLLMAIILMSGSITSFLKSDFFLDKLTAVKKEKDASNLKPLAMLALIFGVISFSNSTYAMSLSTAEEKAMNLPWLKIESADLYMMVIINLVLVGVLLYLRSTFLNFVKMVKPVVVEKVVPASAKPARKVLRKLNTILTDVVPVEDEAKILMDHEYDGIQELDNNLPPWWVWGFWATIIFAFVYMIHYHVFKTGDLQVEEYRKEMVKSKAEINAYLSKMAMNVDETNATLLEDDKSLTSGKALFAANCVLCHNPNGEGNIGPNLTDEYWIYSPDVKDVFKIIKYGATNGMPEHASKLNPIQMQELSSYVLSMPAVSGKEPQGDKFEK